MSSSRSDQGLPVVGWREWVALPELGIERIKPKIDTGARSSSLHAFDVTPFQRGGHPWVRFRVKPLQRDAVTSVTAEARVVEYRQIKSSSGHVTRRPVISTLLEMMGQRWEIELTLANRDEMGFRMLLGREAVRGRFLVDSGRSYYGGRPRQKKKKKKKKAGRKASASKKVAPGDLRDRSGVKRR